jgi:hypothetical protein
MTSAGRVSLTVALSAAWAAAVLTGCGLGTPDVATLQVTQIGWDSLAISLRFENGNLLGRRTRAVPRAARFAVFSASYDTLYAGSDSVIAVPDRLLGDGETILVEGCGEFPSDIVCEQQTVFASPKRIWSGLDVDYPSDLEYARGDYRTRPMIERRRFGEESWEPLPDAPVPPLAAHVLVAGSPGEGLRIPLGPEGGRFDLRSVDGYRDFRFNLRSAFRDSGRAEVIFQVVAGEEGMESPAGSVRIALVDRSEEDLLEGLQVIVREAGRRLVDTLQGVFGMGRTFVFIDAWSYDPRARRYSAELVFYSSGSSRDGWQDFKGRLEASEDGRYAVFRFREASSDATRRWRDAVGSDSLSLAPLPATTAGTGSSVRGW